MVLTLGLILFLNMLYIRPLRHLQEDFNIFRRFMCMNNLQTHVVRPVDRNVLQLRMHILPILYRNQNLSMLSALIK